VDLHSPSLSHASTSAQVVAAMVVALAGLAG
jgi:hypothetical protein